MSDRIAAAAKLAVSETAQDRGTLAAVNTDADAGYSFDASSYCADVEIGARGVITARAANPGATPPAQFTLTPRSAAGRLEWECVGTGKASQLPAECRQ